MTIRHSSPRSTEAGSMHRMSSDMSQVYKQNDETGAIELVPVPDQGTIT